jgi:SagB-type dehydrogenase family enzyme
MKRICFFVLILILVTVTSHAAEIIKLTQPKYTGNVSIEQALMERRSIRSYKAEPLAFSDISQILWAAQGVTEKTRGLRTAPSPRVMYLIEVYLVAGNVIGIPAGLYKYQPNEHGLLKIAEGDIKTKLYAAVGQSPIKNAPAALILTGMQKRSTNPGWMYLEAGHAAQNVYLQAVSLNLGTVSMGGFIEENVKKALNLPNDELTIYIMPLGKK